MFYEEKLKFYHTAFEDYLDSFLKSLNDNLITETIKYPLMVGGKRIRPILLLACGEMLGVGLDKTLPFALALEIIHTSSLVHDDLPALDNDNFRRGQPSCHAKFGEFAGILSGDALLNLAYELVLSKIEDKKDVECVKFLSQLTGYNGMLGGQYLDVYCEKNNISHTDNLKEIQFKKTACLIIAPSVLASILADNKYRENLNNFGYYLGITFQIVDDILDCESNAQILGKSVGKDRLSGKLTNVSVYGLEKSKQQVKEYTKRAIDSIINIENSKFLVELAKRLAERIN